MSGGFALEDRFLVHDDLLDALLRGHVVHDVEHRLFEDGAQAAGAALARERLLARRRASAPFVNLSFTPSISNSFWNCLTRLFFGFVRMSISASSFSSCKVAMTGKRPMNSGIRPNFSRSSGCTCASSSPSLHLASCA